MTIWLILLYYLANNYKRICSEFNVDQFYNLTFLFWQTHWRKTYFKNFWYQTLRNLTFVSSFLPLYYTLYDILLSNVSKHYQGLNSLIDNCISSLACRNLIIERSVLLLYPRQIFTPTFLFQLSPFPAFLTFISLSQIL